MGDYLKELHEIAAIIGNPVLIVLTITILSLLVFIFYIAKQAGVRESKYFEMIVTLTEEVNESSQTLARLTALIEILVHSVNKDNS